jgi:isopentenyl-diphosphate delta-isomerase
MANTPHEEILDLVNDKDEVIGTIDRSRYGEMVENNLGYIRSVELLIRNDEGKYWIPTRTADKKIAPNGLDYSMGGHIDAGEEYTDAALREIREELNLSLTPEDLIYITKFPPSLIHYFRAVYLYESNVTPTYNPKDFTGAEWLSQLEIEDKLNSGVPSKSNLLITVQEVERFINQRG